MTPLRDITDFVWWLPNVACAAELQVIQAVTGTELPIDGISFPADATDLSRVICLVEAHKLHNELCRVATVDQVWWRVVANWDRLVDALDRDEPEWRNGKATEPTQANEALNALYARPITPRRVLLDMDGPLTHFDHECVAVSETNGWEFDCDPLDPDQREHRYITDHMPEAEHRHGLRAAIDATGWYRELPVTPGALEGVEALLSAGHEVVICSKPHEANETCEPEKKAWLAEHFPALRDNYIFTNNKAFADGGPNGILLDDDLKPSQVRTARWSPVAFSTVFNGPGTKWGRYPQWKWGDPIERLAW